MLLLHYYFHIYIFVFFQLSYGILNSISNEKYIVLHLYRLGLSNRLRTISDWFVIARKSKRHLLVSWEPSYDCNISFFELFQEGSLQFSILENPLPYGNDGKLLVTAIANESNLSIAIIERFDDFFYHDDKNILFQDIDVIYTNHDGAIVLPETPCQNYILFRSKFYQSLVPTIDIKEMVDDLMKYFHNRIMIGVHIRIHDQLYDWEIVPPTPGESYPSMFGVTTKLKHFKIQLDSIQNLFQKNSHDLSHRFYITSNDIATKKELLSYYPDAISVFSSGDTSRNTRDGMKLSLVEWILLSKCDMIINTFGSSYASQASLVNRIPLVSLWSESAIYQLDIRLPYCGSLHYLKYFTKNQITNSQIVSLNPCPLLSEWGLLNLYSISK